MLFNCLNQKLKINYNRIRGKASFWKRKVESDINTVLKISLRTIWLGRLEGYPYVQPTTVSLYNNKKNKKKTHENT